jgi:hypothetical protein
VVATVFRLAHRRRDMLILQWLNDWLEQLVPLFIYGMEG